MTGLEKLKVFHKIVSGMTLVFGVTFYPFTVAPGYCAFSDQASKAAAVDSDFSQADAGKAESDIAKLEDKFFQHTYPKDTWQVRLDRVEKMVFGEAKTGSSKERLAALLAAVPNLPSSDSGAQDQGATKTAQNNDDGGKAARHRHSKASSDSGSGSKSTPEPEKVTADDSTPPADESPGGYPAVTAIEKKVFGKDYATEPVNQRLTRLETNVFGKPSTSNDLSDRVDRLKQKTGIDIARQSSGGSDWSDEDENSTTSFGMPSRRSYSGSGQSYSRSDDNFGFDTSQGDSSIAGGSMGSGMGAGMMSQSPVRHRPSSSASDLDSLGLDQQVASLEREIFGKTYAHDPLGARLNRLEASVFPQKKPSVDLPLPDRVKNLLAVIPISQKNLPGRRREDDDTDLAEGNSAAGSSQSSHGLNKIISSLSNMMGGSNTTGGYPVRSGNYITDPKTGYLIDPVTGNAIDPNTGTVVGRVAPTQNYGSGLGSYNSFGSFGNGFSPMGSPYGSYYGGSPYGMGGMGSGMRFGFGGGRFGGF